MKPLSCRNTSNQHCDNDLSAEEKITQILKCAKNSYNMFVCDLLQVFVISQRVFPGAWRVGVGWLCSFQSRWLKQLSSGWEGVLSLSRATGTRQVVLWSDPHTEAKWWRCLYYEGGEGSGAVYMFRGGGDGGGEEADNVYERWGKVSEV